MVSGMCVFTNQLMAGSIQDDSSHSDYLGQIPPGDTPVLFAPGVVSTGKEHSAAMFTPDLSEM